jgi:hypothetical protein
MRGWYSRIAFTLWRSGLAPAVVPVALAGLLTIGFASSAHALPSFARQTGQPCGACHTDFAGLTPFGRLFKIGGYTAGGGAYRTTLFPSSDDDKQKKWVPPISMMSIVGFTNTQAPLAQPTAPYSTNNNTVISPVSFFWGGAITDHLGAFAQLTYNAPPVGGFGNDPYQSNWTWDNTDVRFADSTSIGKMTITYGITANNNPTVQDPWNTTPAWSFPYASSTVANTPAAGTLINGGLAAHAASVGAYAFINNVLYLEGSVYQTLKPNTQSALGTDPFGAPGLSNPSPYWRVAVEPHWGNHWFEMGTFGMMSDIHPWVAGPSPLGTPPPLPVVNTATFPQTDKYTDIGIDSQYQYQGSNYWITLRGSYIHEYQKLDASYTNGLSTNPSDDLNEARAYASVAYGNDNRVVLTGQYFNTWGTPDPALYANYASGISPNSTGWIAEVAYIPFMSSQAPGWPWFNARVGLQYTAFTKFDGTSVGASANNTLFLYLWLAM